MLKSPLMFLIATISSAKRLFFKTLNMSGYVLMAVAGGLLINTLSIDGREKKRDLFYKADMKYHEKKGYTNVKISTAKTRCMFSNFI